MKKLTFKERIMAFLQGGDDEKISRMEKATKRFFVKQKKQRNDAIDALEEEIIDAKNDLKTALEVVDVSQLGDSKSIDAYVAKYVSGVKRAKDALAERTEKIEAIKEEIKRAEELEAIIFEETSVEDASAEGSN
jgi:aminoglycoside phosphotransferase